MAPEELCGHRGFGWGQMFQVAAEVSDGCQCCRWVQGIWMGCRAFGWVQKREVNVKALDGCSGFGMVQRF